MKIVFSKAQRWVPMVSRKENAISFSSKPSNFGLVPGFDPISMPR
jgi:hypothetical protein